MSTFDLLNISAAVAIVVISGYTAFWALVIRRALAIQVYRRQALGIALVAAMLGLLNAVNTASAYLIYGSPFAALGQGAYGVFFLLLVTLFYWVDASVVASRRSDPLARDTLHWSKLRIALWIGTLPAAVLVIPVSAYALLFQGGNAAGPPPIWTAPIIVPGIFIPTISAAILLPIIARRTADQKLRKHLEWFGLFAIAFLVVYLFLSNNVTNQTLGLTFSYLGSFASAYCLYRSVSFLAPLKPPPVNRTESSSES